LATSLQGLLAFFSFSSTVALFILPSFLQRRPALKGYVRQMSSFLQTCRQIEIFAPSSLSSYALYEAMAIAQHHDAVAGTEVGLFWSSALLSPLVSCS
jgi:hypothetical protein